MSTTPRQFPIQNSRALLRDQLLVSEPVYMAAYEVYCEVFSPQEALIDLERGCRGGFSVGELVAFLYARPFPRAEWRKRTDEAFAGQKNL